MVWYARIFLQDSTSSLAPKANLDISSVSGSLPSMDFVPRANTKQHSQMPSGHGKKRASFFGRLSLKGNPSPERDEKRAPLGNWALQQMEKHPALGALGNPKSSEVTQSSARLPTGAPRAAALLRGAQEPVGAAPLAVNLHRTGVQFSSNKRETCLFHFSLARTWT